jgi:hypothetical protein
VTGKNLSTRNKAFLAAFLISILLMVVALAIFANAIKNEKGEIEKKKMTAFNDAELKILENEFSLQLSNDVKPKSLYYVKVNTLWKYGNITIKLYFEALDVDEFLTSYCKFTNVQKTSENHYTADDKFLKKVWIDVVDDEIVLTKNAVSSKEFKVLLESLPEM